MPNAAGKCVPVMPPEVVDQPSAASNPPAAALSEEAAARLSLAEDRMNLSISLPECLCMKHPRTVSYADVGDPEGYVVRWNEIGNRQSAIGGSVKVWEGCDALSSAVGVPRAT